MSHLQFQLCFLRGVLIYDHLEGSLLICSLVQWYVLVHVARSYHNACTSRDYIDVQQVSSYLPNLADKFEVSLGMWVENGRVLVLV